MSLDVHYLITGLVLAVVSANAVVLCILRRNQRKGARRAEKIQEQLERLTAYTETALETKASQQKKDRAISGE